MYFPWFYIFKNNGKLALVVLNKSKKPSEILFKNYYRSNQSLFEVLGVFHTL